MTAQFAAAFVCSAIECVFCMAKDTRNEWLEAVSDEEYGRLG